jgi:uncharacterized protein involved in exopolysaccharide biosynthesis
VTTPRHRVPGEDTAEWLLGIVTSHARASAIVGDLSEQAATRSIAWFWRCTLRITLACARQSFFSTSIQETDMTRESHGFLGTVWRYKWLLAACMLVSLVAANIALSFYPPRYRSQAAILVVPARVPDEYVHLPKTEDVALRLTSLQHQILSRTRLERMINELDLYAEARQHGIMEDVIQNMRADISVQIVGNDTFRIGFDGSNPRTVQKVTQRLASLFIDENLHERSMLAENTNRFIENEIEETHGRLDQKESAINARTKSGHPPSKAESIEFEELQQQYRDLLNKRQAAILATNLEHQQIGEQFRLLEPARIPEEPITPNRMAADAGGVVAGLGLGVAVIGLRSRRRLRGDDDQSEATRSDDVPSEPS